MKEERFVVFDLSDDSYLLPEKSEREVSGSGWWTRNVRHAKRYTDLAKEDPALTWQPTYLRMPVGIANNRDAREVFIAAHKAFGPSASDEN